MHWAAMNTPSIQYNTIHNISDGGSNKNLVLFIHVNSIYGAPSIMGTNQFPNHPIGTGITTKKIITKAWAITVTL